MSTRHPDHPVLGARYSPGYVNRFGYVMLSDRGKGGSAQEHRALAEFWFGPIPDGFQVHHVDGNPGNNARENLQVLSPLDHQRIHRGWVRDASGEWSGKPCGHCKETLPLDQFYITARGLRGVCKPCARRRARLWAKENPELNAARTRRWARKKRAAELAEQLVMSSPRSFRRPQ